jgi:hypothetical protein
VGVIKRKNMWRHGLNGMISELEKIICYFELDNEFTLFQNKRGKFLDQLNNFDIFEEQIIKE